MTSIPAQMPDGTRVRGGAQIDDGILLLIERERLTGSWLLAPPTAQPAHLLFRPVLMLLGGIDESGLCLSYGPLDVTTSSAVARHLD